MSLLHWPGPQCQGAFPSVCWERTASVLPGTFSARARRRGTRSPAGGNSFQGSGEAVALPNEGRRLAPAHSRQVDHPILPGALIPPGGGESPAPLEGRSDCQDHRMRGEGLIPSALLKCMCLSAGGGPWIAPSENPDPVGLDSSATGPAQGTYSSISEGCAVPEGRLLQLCILQIRKLSPGSVGNRLTLHL